MIRVTLADRVATVAMDRPAARNAFPVAGWYQLAEALAALPGETCVVVLASSSPAIFSAGADLRELALLAEDADAREPFRVAMRTGIEAVAGLPMPVIAAVDGPCHGAAVALALAADLRIVTPMARFAIPPARLGIAYPAEDVARLAALVGAGQAARLLFTGAAIDADEALRIGLVEAIGDAAAVAAQIAGNDAAALATLKAMLRDPADPGHAAAFIAGFAGEVFRASTARYREP